MIMGFFRGVSFSLFLLQSSFAASVELDVSGFGFDSIGNALVETPTDGQVVYDNMGNALGSWQVTTGNSFTATLSENNRNESSGITYANSIRADNTNSADSHTASFSSFNAGLDTSDYIVIDNESLDISVSWRYRDIRWQRRDIEVGAGQVNPSYDLSWSITSFDNIDADLGNQTGQETLTSLGINQSFGYTGYVDVPLQGSNQIVSDVNFTGDIPDSLLEYSGGAVGQLTGKYDGSDFELTLATAQSRDTNAIAAWDDSDDGDGDGIEGEAPRAQLRAFLDANYDYSLEYTTFTFINVPEPGSVSLFLFGFGFLLIGRHR